MKNCSIYNEGADEILIHLYLSPVTGAKYPLNMDLENDNLSLDMVDVRKIRDFLNEVLECQS